VNITIQFSKYVTVALLSAASDWLVFSILLATCGWVIMAQATSRIVGGLVSFGINKYWSFQSYQHTRVLREPSRFVLLFIGSYCLSLFLFSALTYLDVRPYWAKLITDTSCFFFNFIAMRFWVYRLQPFAATAAGRENASAKSGQLPTRSVPAVTKFEM
jgi:putative flippase GtrA